MKRSKHMAKRAKGLKILKIIIILAITFLAGIIVTFCQKQSKPVVTDENRTTQSTSSKPKKHKKAEVKKDKGRDTKVSDNINAPADTSASKTSENESDRIERAKKALDKYCRGDYITGQEAADLDWYCKKYHINPQPAENDHYVGQTRYDDSEPSEDNYDNSGNDDEAYNGGMSYDGDGQAEDNNSVQTNVSENDQSSGNGNNNYQGGGNYGNN